MKDTGSDKCIINAAIGGWYKKGQKRLVDSLKSTNYSHDYITWDDWSNNYYDKNCPYNIKAMALEDAIAVGYTKIFWIDSSMWAEKNPDSIFDLLNETPVYCERNGYTAAQECNDESLNYFLFTRDEAENIPMCSSGFLGINLEHSVGRQFAELWIKAAKDGIFKGSRLHDKQSKDMRFLHHRQDQSAASLIMYRLGLKLYEAGRIWYYKAEQQPSELTIFACQGM